MKGLVLAGGDPQIALLQELKSRNIVTVLADYNKEPVAKPYADFFYQVSTLDVDAIRDVAIKEEVDFLITACTDQALLTVAQVSEQLSLPCYIDYETALNVTNKVHMKQIFAENKIPTARHLIMVEFSLDAISCLEFPVVVKPVDCNSSKGVTKVAAYDQLEDAFNEAVRLSRTGCVIVEEFVEGQEISIDAMVVDSKVQILTSSYVDKIPSDNGFLIYRVRFPIAESEEVCRQIEEVAQKIADCFGLRNCPMLIQALSCNNKLYVIEFSARTGGGLKYRLIPKLSGVDVMKAVVDMTLGNSVQFTTKEPEAKYLSNVFAYCRTGIFDRLAGFEELKTSGVLAEYHLYKTPGTEMREPKSSGDRIAGFTIQADSLRELHEKYNSVVKHVSVLDPSGKDIMYRDMLCEL